jgi:hypothetical protein
MRGARWLRPILLFVVWSVVGDAPRADEFSPPGRFVGDDAPNPPPPPPQPPWVFDVEHLPAPPRADLSQMRRAAAATDYDLWFAAWDRFSRDPRQQKTQTDGEWVAVTSNVTLDAPPAWDDPLPRREWKRQDDVKVSVAGPLFVFGQVGAGAESVEQRDMKVSGKTGLACKLTLGTDGEVVLRSGPSVTCSDPMRFDRTKSEWLVEVQARWPLLASINLEYQGTASPALTPVDHDRINQDLGLALPLGTGGKLRLGARHQWENSLTPKPTADSMQLYLGFEWVR